MTAKMPEPSVYRYKVVDAYGEVIVDRPDGWRVVEAIGYITTDQAEAYAQERVNDALEALETAQEYIADALARHDQEYSKHPAAQGEREQIKNDLDLIGSAIRALKKEQSCP